MLWVFAAVNIETRPGQVQVVFVRRTENIVRHDVGLVFKRRDGIDVVNHGYGRRPAAAAVSRFTHPNATERARGAFDADAVERHVRVVRDAFAAEGNGIVALSQVARILRADSRPGLAAIRGYIATIAHTCPRSSILKRDANEVVWILGIDGERNFARITGVFAADSDHTMRLWESGKRKD